MGPLFRFFEALGLRCCVCMCDVGSPGGRALGVGGGGACEGMHFPQSKNARLLNY